MSVDNYLKSVTYGQVPRAVEELKLLLDESGKRNREKLLQRDSV